MERLFYLNYWLILFGSCIYCAYCISSWFYCRTSDSYKNHKYISKTDIETHQAIAETEIWKCSV